MPSEARVLVPLTGASVPWLHFGSLFTKCSSLFAPASLPNRFSSSLCKGAFVWTNRVTCFYCKHSVQWLCLLYWARGFAGGKKPWRSLSGVSLIKQVVITLRKKWTAHGLPRGLLPHYVWIQVPASICRIIIDLIQGNLIISSCVKINTLDSCFIRPWRL